MMFNSKFFLTTLVIIHWFKLWLIYTITNILLLFVFCSYGGARWSSGQCARRAIAEAMHRSQWPVMGWVTKIYYLELLCASEGTLSRWSRLHLQSWAPTPVSRRVDVRQAAGRKNNCRIFITTWWKTCCTDPT
jgi:hypothetical protein